MPEPIHQGLLFLIRTNPRLVFELAERFDAKFEDGRHGYEDAANELPDLQRQRIESCEDLTELERAWEVDDAAELLG